MNTAGEKLLTVIIVTETKKPPKRQEIKEEKNI